MAQNSKIEWCDHTFNPFIGCTKVGPGCDNCYAETRNVKGEDGVAVNWGPGAPRRRTSIKNWNLSLRWNAEHDAFFAKHGRRQRVFCASLADVFDNAVDPQWREDLFSLIQKTPNLDWLLLTKRIGNAAAMLPWGASNATPWPNVWLGATIVNQEEADRDIVKLMATPAAMRFLSMEPLLGPVVFPTLAVEHASLDWVIVGGETGENARPCHLDWIEGIQAQCEKYAVPFLFKQWGDWAPRSTCHHTLTNGLSASAQDPDCTKWPAVRLTHVGKDGHRLENVDNGQDIYMQKVGKKLAGRELSGKVYDGYPHC